MDIPEALAFVAPTTAPCWPPPVDDGTPQLSPVTVAVDDAGRVVVSSRETAVKTRNVRRDPRAFVCVFTDRFFGSWVQLGGTATCCRCRTRWSRSSSTTARWPASTPDWADYRRAMEAERRVLLRITPTGAGPNVSG